ncbi:MAG: flagellar hook-length control protein FliK, partial [Gammaproteobacteria bacterium]|nr:flagellar hook-length control protein FliK [Gammaproteobacteria bacterium]
RLNVEKESANPALQTSSTFNRHSSVSNAMFDSKDTITTNNTINHNTLLNPEDSASGKIVENPKEQQSDKTPTINTSTKSTSHQNLAKIDSSNNESSIIFNTNLNSADTNIAKPSDNTAFANNNGINIGEISSSANTSSDNSSYNNQDPDILSEFNINSVNTRKNAVPETNFNDALSQINNSSKPLGTIGNDVADNIIQSARMYMEGGKSEIKMQLNPQELGSLKLEFTVDDDILDAKITVERSAVK